MTDIDFYYSFIAGWIMSWAWIKLWNASKKL